jgi:hypothetical protein
MSYIEIGLAAIATAFKVNEQTMDALAAPDQKIDELLRRIREANGLLIETQSAFHSAAAESHRLAEENRQLRAALSDRSRLEQLRDDMDPSPEGYWIKKSEKASGKFVPYCGSCWGEEKAVPLVPGATSDSYTCGKCESLYFTQGYRDREQKKIDDMARSYKGHSSGSSTSWMR